MRVFSFLLSPLFFGWVFLMSGHVAWAQSCGGGNGVCSTISECSGSVVSDDVCGPLICCLGDRTPGDPLPPVYTCSGSCRSASQGCTAPEVPDNTGTCGTNQVCCTVPDTGGATECALGGGTCRTASSGCFAPEQPSSRSCSSGQICCDIPSGGPGANACTVVPGARCATISAGCSTDETPASRGGCSTGQMCCDRIGGTTPPSGPPSGTPPSGTPPSGTPPSGTPPSGPGVPPVGSTCTNKVAGVCFPTGTGLSEKPIIDILTALLSWILGLFGLIALIGFIISGLQYLLSTGDEGMAETAKRNMKYCILGIIVALSGWIIIRAIDTLLKAKPFI